MDEIDRADGLMAETMDEIESIGAGPTALPAPRLMTEQASCYLVELDGAANLMQQRREEAEVADRGKWLMHPAGKPHRPRKDYREAVFSPLSYMDRARGERLQEAAQHARIDVARVAWWYATAALAALRDVLAGQQVTATVLEQATFRRPDRGPVFEETAPPEHEMFRPELPHRQELCTGISDLDAAMNTALGRCLDAHAAACVAEGLEAKDKLEDWESSDLSDLCVHAAKLPDLLIDYAAAVVQAVHSVDLRRATA